MEKFDFLQLPLVVQDIITEEVVQNSIPKDWLNFALTSKFCNELVQRAHPKKIIHHLEFSRPMDPRFYASFLEFHIEINSNKYFKTMDQMMEMLTNCQVEVLEIDNMSFLSKSSDFLDILDKSLEFVTKLIIDQSITETETATIIGFYRKFRHLNTLVYKQNPFILPHYPPNVVVEHANHRFIGEQYLNFFQDLAKFSRQSPLSSLKIYNYISCDHLRQFLTTARFAKDAEIFAKFHVSFFSLHQVYLRYNERDTFEFEDYPSEAMVVTVDQQITGENERILLLSRMNLERALGFTFTFDFSFDVTSASSRNQPIYSGILTRNKQAFKLDNVKSNDWIKVKFDPGKFHHDVRYSKNFLNTHFPRSDDVPHLNYLDKINIVLGTQIGITKATLKNI